VTSCTRGPQLSSAVCQSWGGSATAPAGFGQLCRPYLVSAPVDPLRQQLHRRPLLVQLHLQELGLLLRADGTRRVSTSPRVPAGRGWAADGANGLGVLAEGASHHHCFQPSGTRPAGGCDAAGGRRREMLGQETWQLGAVRTPVPSPPRRGRITHKAPACGAMPGRAETQPGN